ncbi:MAG: MBL fold metallo-hydrolase [Hyphomicrobiales bacterium]
MRRFGEYEVFILLDGVFDADVEGLVHAKGPEARQSAIAAWGKPTIRMDVNCFLLRGASGTILVDTGCGTMWGEEFGKARNLLAALGVTPESVDHVLLTHVHGDHAYGLFDGDQPYFLRALVHVSRPELAFFTDPAARETLPKTRQGGFDVTATIQRLYGERVKAFPHGPLMPGIEAMPLPGHTAGHTGYLLKDKEHSLLIWGDMLHMPDVQPADPELGMIYDLDPATAIKTRRQAVVEAARQGWVIAGSHVTGFNRVEAGPNGPRVVSA